MRTSIVVLALCALVATFGNASAQMTPIGAELIAGGFVSPLAVVAAPGDPDRLFVLDQIGLVYVIHNGALLPEPFLDIRDRMIALNPNYSEAGLLGLTFHPNYAENGRFFIKYSAPLRPEAPENWSNTSTLSEFMVLPDNPDRADHTSERIVLEIDHPQGNHNGGTIAFGHDGYLYTAEGDGGGAHDTGEGHPPLGNGQDTTTLLGAFLRIDVDGAHPYEVPPTNPFVDNPDVRDEIWAYGFRNPYAWSFDMGGEHGLLAGDVGQHLWEEVDQVEMGGNYGWNLREGFHCFDPDNPFDPPADCPDTGYQGEPLLDPVLAYPTLSNPHEQGLDNAVIGGYVYRGSSMAWLDGLYIFGGLTRTSGTPNGGVYVAYPQAGTWDMEQFHVRVFGSNDVAARGIGEYVKGFGQDLAGEVYVTTSRTLGPNGETGKVFRLVPVTRQQLQQEVASDPHGIDGSAMVRRVGRPMHLQFTIPEASAVEVSIHDIRGRTVRTLASGEFAAGAHEIGWDGTDAMGATVPSGMYFYRVGSQSGVAARRIVLIR